MKFIADLKRKKNKVAKMKVKSKEVRDRERLPNRKTYRSNTYTNSKKKTKTRRARAYFINKSLRQDRTHILPAHLGKYAIRILHDNSLPKTHHLQTSTKIASTKDELEIKATYPITFACTV